MPPRAKKATGPTVVSSSASKPAAPKAAPKRKSTTAAPKTAKEDEAVPAPASRTKPSASQAARPVKKPAAGDDLDALLRPFYYNKSLTDPINTARDKWNLLPAFLRVKGLIKQHTDSFDYFIDVELKKIIKANEQIISDDTRKWIKFTDIRVGKPCRVEDLRAGYVQTEVTPNECRLRDMTYAAPIYVDLVYPRQSGNVRKTDVLIGRVPMMLRSSKCVLSGRSESEMSWLNECAVDPGGYFIVRGQEKVILVQEQLSKNRVIVESFKGVIQASVTSHTANIKTKTYVLLKKGYLYLKHNSLTEDVPVAIVMRAMGVQSDHEILLLAAGNDAQYQDEFAPNLELAAGEGVFTQEQALDFIANRIKPDRFVSKKAVEKTPKQQALEKLAGTIIPHVEVEGLNFRPKALYVAHMTRRVLMAIHDPKLVDDRDYVGNKRLELAGQMLALLFEDLFKDCMRQIKTTMDKVLKKQNPTQEFDPVRIVEQIEPRITSGMERAISTGNWTLKRFRMDRAGVTHVLSRLSYISALGMMTRISSQFEKTRKVSGPRALQPSQFGMLCTSDTPEGEACGLVKNLALMTHITTADDEGPVRKMIYVLGAEDVTSASGTEIYGAGAYIIFINGTPAALTRQPKQFLLGFRKFRRMGRISEFVSIFINHHHNGVHIATDEGRVCRPLIVVEKSKSKVTTRFLESLRQGTMNFDDALSRGIVEYLDVNEENDSNIAVYEKDIGAEHTHLEIEPFTILGAVAGLIPYPHHNQSPRNTYQCAMGKQAIGAIAYNQFTRIDTLLYLMVYPQKPMVTTRTIELVKYDKLPAGQNAVVAVMSYSGYDIEDALVLNKASCDRGFGRCQVFKKVSMPLKAYQNGFQDRLADRDPSNTRHRKIGKDGLVEVGSELENGDMYMLKEQPINQVQSVDRGSQRWSPAHMSYKLPDPCYADKVVITANEQNTTILKIQTRQTRRPEIGDKFSSRHGQKGVVGLLAEQADMPFSDQGVVPDIIMNPHGFPSRMTVGKMLELVSGKAGVLAGKQEYGTPFGGSKVEDMGAVLIKHGFSYSGKDTLTSGITGESLPFYVFFGPIYYQKLKHMVQDKMHSRSTGPRAILTRQPTEGRSRQGGLRLGEMERDCLIAYGASQLLLERLMISSDAHDVDVCQNCGMMGYNNWCQSCSSSRSVVRMTMPYAAKLLIQELMSMNVKASLQLADEFPREE
ncbi:Putative DNA-directed RNA polymerase, subunit 2, hybrid-binding domain, RNA polymerase, beta subunit [Septoria linicola]|uniref:DNA-directed RNA polymerase subunit beta n=1 Tax=Septoria linicola TaxID=215465 RepID=A0A9Q9AM66_9PEZI|nr:putative DNA-directed RNA polymerase, subunit 2, hybrid-binding domain, RNA polymerase, beta subunit [Septoria linicola]USW49508.1 Putative DNA-directed RNA polymerase, subunit 2, hybrid-binding domain, RNA polymerase, beta subunit [Septoria linicola]